MERNDYLELLAYDRWANAKWAPLAQDYAELSAVVAHIEGAQRNWLERIQNEPSPAEAKDVEATWRELVQREDLDRVVAYRNRAGVPFERSLGEIVRHLANHGTYHRGQMREIAGRFGLEFPDTDFIYFCDAQRAGE
jgi:uncharacterized damage-inducible protein DinB